MAQYTLLLLPEADGSGITVECPALPGLVTYGQTRDEALAMAREAVELYIESLTARGLDVPVESAPPELATLEVELPVGFAPVPA
jgi:antitoxin HicB